MFLEEKLQSLARLCLTDIEKSTCRGLLELGNQVLVVQVFSY